MDNIYSESNVNGECTLSRDGKVIATYAEVDRPTHHGEAVEEVERLKAYLEQARDHSQRLADLITAALLKGGGDE